MKNRNSRPSQETPHTTYQDVRNIILYKEHLSLVDAAFHNPATAVGKVPPGKNPRKGNISNYRSDPPQIVDSDDVTNSETPHSD